MATYYTAVRTFVELRNATEHGMVNHALASGIRDILKDYHHLTARLESLYLSSPDFTLQAAYLYLHPTLHTLAILHSLCLSLDFEEDPADDSEAHSSGEDDSEDEEDAALAKELGLDRLGAGGLKDPDASDPKGPILGGEVLGLLAIRAAQMSGWVSHRHHFRWPMYLAHPLFAQGPHGIGTSRRLASTCCATVRANFDTMD